MQLYGAQGYHFTYARNDLGEIMALGDEPGLVGGDWANLGKPGGVTAPAQGVAATFESSNGNVHVFAVGQNGNLYEGITDSTYQVSWTQFAPRAARCLPATGWMAVNAVFFDSCDRRVSWQAIFSGPDFVGSGTYEVVNGGNPLVRLEDVQSGSFCFAATDGTAVLTEVVDYERAAGSFEDVTMAQVPCERKLDPPEDPTIRSRFNFSFDAVVQEKCPLE